MTTFSLGYLAGYLALCSKSSSFQKNLILYNFKEDNTHLKKLGQVHESRVLVRDTRRDYNESPVDQSTNGYSYLLVLYYFEQMNNALRNLLRLGPVAMNLDMRIVEPFVVHSRLYGLPDMLPPKEVTGAFYSLRTLFNISSINQSLYSYARATLTSFEDFVHYAPRDVTVVYFVHNEGHRPRTFCLSYRYLRILKLVTEAEIPVIDCTNEVSHEEQIYNGLLDTLSNLTAKYGVANFKIVKFICVDGERDTTTSQIRAQLGPKKTTVIIPEWRGCGYRICNLKLRHSIITHHRAKLLYTLKGEKETPLNLTYVSSDLVMKTADLFMKNLNLTTKQFISIYMRMEKLVKTNSTIHIDTRYLKCCTSTLQKVLASVKRRYKLSNVLLTTDLGRYGSDACPGQCQVVGMKVLKNVENTNKIKMFDYDPSKTPLKIDNNGFAAMVEMEMLARASRLITVGLGQFKEQLAHLYGKKTGHANDVYSICKERNLNVLHEFANLPSHC